MPTEKIERSRVVERLTDVFRRRGYEGATLQHLAEAAGLQKASLYHRFPGGKRDMAEAVLVAADAWFASHVFEPLAESDNHSPRERLVAMTRALTRFYDKGDSPCLLDSISLGEGSDLFAEHTRRSVRAWIVAVARVAEEAGIEPSEATRRAEDAVMRVEGALVLTRATGNRRGFRRVMAELPDDVLA